MGIPRVHLTRAEPTMSWDNSKEWDDVSELLYSTETDHKREGLARVSNALVILQILSSVTILGDGMEGARCCSCSTRSDCRSCQLHCTRGRMCSESKSEWPGFAADVRYGNYKVCTN